MMSYQDWQSLCASDPERANAICAEAIERQLLPSELDWHDASGKPAWSPITTRDHAAMMVEKVAQAGVTRIKFTLVAHELLDFDAYGSGVVAALMAPPSLIAYCACVALEGGEA